MPTVELDLDIDAPLDRVWAAVIDVEKYPETMASVRWVRLLASANPDPAVRHTAWSVNLKGSILEWEVDERLDHDAHVMRSRQRTGDMEIYEAEWIVTEIEPGVTRARLEITFEIGIPLLADMLNPVAVRSLRENSTDMLRGIEREALEASGR